MTRRLGLGATFVASTLLLAACGSSGAATTPASAVAVTPAPAASQAAPSQAAPSQPAASDGGAAAAACTVSGSGGTAASIEGFAFPAGLSIKAGDSITWTNKDSAPHTVTFTDGTCDSGVIAPGASVTVTYTVPGTYAFGCKIHTNMKGSLDVKG